MKDELAGHRERLRERFLKTGLSGFAEHEVLELLLTLCIPRKDVKGLAKVLLKKFGSLRGVFEASQADLESVSGIGKASAICIALIRDFASYYLQQKTTQQVLFSNNASLVAFWKSRLMGLRHEVVEIAYLDASYRLMQDGIERLEDGFITRIHLQIRKVLASALKREATNIIIAHNHPSGDPKPSQADLQLTQTLQHVGYTLQIRLLDHIIIAKDNFYSFRQEGFLE